MAANPIAYVHNGSVEIPEELKADPRFSEGAALQLVPQQASLKSEHTQREEQHAWAEFIKLRGIFANSDWGGNAELEAEKQRELAQEMSLGS